VLDGGGLLDVPAHPALAAVIADVDLGKGVAGACHVRGSQSARGVDCSQHVIPPPHIQCSYLRKK
jgi:hypothetical protein